MAINKSIKTFSLVLLLLFTTNGFANVPQDDSKKELSFGILPFLSPVALIKRFSPLRQYLEGNTGETIIVESAPNFPEYVRRTLNHEYDIVYTAPHFVPASLDDGHFQLLAASSNIAAHIIVENSSRITSITQLAGKRISHGPKQAFLVIIAKHLLKANGITGKHAPVFIPYKSHNAALRAVSGKESDAAIVGTFHLNLAKKHGLSSIVSTPSYPGVALLASKDLPESFRNKLAKSFISIKESKEGRETLKKIHFPGFTSVTVEDYEKLRSIALDVLDPKTFELIQN